jgi:hypothetical protein
VGSDHFCDINKSAVGFADVYLIPISITSFLLFFIKRFRFIFSGNCTEKLRKHHNYPARW